MKRFEVSLDAVDNVFCNSGVEPSYARDVSPDYLKFMAVIRGEELERCHIYTSRGGSTVIIEEDEHPAKICIIGIDNYRAFKIWDMRKRLEVSLGLLIKETERREGDMLE